MYKANFLIILMYHSLVYDLQHVINVYWYIQKFYDNNLGVPVIRLGSIVSYDFNTIFIEETRYTLRCVVLVTAVIVGHGTEEWTETDRKTCIIGRIWKATSASTRK